jgi:hypothetical protein
MKCYSYTNIVLGCFVAIMTKNPVDYGADVTVFNYNDYVQSCL